MERILAFHVEHAAVPGPGRSVTGDDALRALTEGLAELELPAGPPTLSALLELSQKVVAWGRRMNLTAHRSPEAVVRRLVLDAAALLVHAPPFSSLADLGSGAGFPGFPVAILRPEVQVTLVESRERRHHFQRAVVRDLRLGNARLLRGRLEALTPRPHRAVVAQALAPAPQALAWMLPWAEPGGWLLLPGGEQPPQPGPLPGVAHERTQRYRVPLGGPPRSLWIGRRLEDAS